MRDAAIAILIARWHGWPPWTPVFLKTLAENPTIDFHVLSDTAPVPTGSSSPLPPNVIFHRWTLQQLLVRLRETVGEEVTDSISARGTAPSSFCTSSRDPSTCYDMSSAKVNDFKPTFGEAFARDLLAPYAWWGWLQEDVLLGNLSACLTPEVLESHDVVTPTFWPWNSSGVFMLWRNVRHVNRLWRRSANASLVLASPRYFVFDEWWGASDLDHTGRVIGREVERGAIRLLRAPRFRERWSDVALFGDDLYLQTAPLFACWNRGSVHQNRPDTGGEAYDEMPCLGMRGGVEQRGKAAAAVCVLHLIVLKRAAPIAQLPVPLPEEAERALQRATQFAMTRDGLWLPADDDADGGGDATRGRSWLLVNGSRVLRLTQPQVRANLDELSGGAMSKALSKRAAKSERRAQHGKHETINDQLRAGGADAESTQRIRSVGRG